MSRKIVFAAGVVLFGASSDQVKRIVCAVRANVSDIYLFVNAYLDKDVRSEIACCDNVTLIESDVNLGVGEALNKIIEAASRNGCEAVFLFDQDSRPVANALSEVVRIFQSLEAETSRVAGVAPRLVSPPGVQHKCPRYVLHATTEALETAVPVHYLPTSGTLISIDAFREIGPFRGDYFIDGIDLEWCFRAWSKGYSCWLATDVTMEHTVGEGSVGAFGFRTPHQKDFRLETYVRNTVYGFRLPHIPLSWKLRQAAYLVAQVALLSVANRFRPSLLKRLGRGFVNGLRGRLGPPEGVPFT